MPALFSRGRLIRGGVIAPSDLLPPTQAGPKPEVLIGALILHPDARRVRRKLERVMGPGCGPRRPRCLVDEQG